MKKLLYFISILMIALCANQSNLKAGTAGTGSHTILVTAYYCIPGPGLCFGYVTPDGTTLYLYGIICPITIRVPINNVVPPLDNGVTENHDFFLYTDSPSTLTGKGYKNGLMRYTNQSNFEVFEVDDQVQFTDYLLWNQAVQ